MYYFVLNYLVFTQFLQIKIKIYCKKRFQMIPKIFKLMILIIVFIGQIMMKICKYLILLIEFNKLHHSYKNKFYIHMIFEIYKVIINFIN